ncbi:nuclease-related domain-containing protein [Streptomyces sp. NPDC001404]|uniref:nuclease-related domain-containing protein n=1 Tax=Streptomyces sp. NPDC001404 TaxID=3364571 RepID=UPI003682AE40
MSAGSSAQARAAALRAAQQPADWWLRLQVRLGVAAAIAPEAGADAARWEAGAEGERRTAALLMPLAEEGWYGLWDRHVPDSARANADHVLITPGGRALLADAKLWSGKYRVRIRNGRLHHGDSDYGDSIDNVRYEASQIQKAIRRQLGLRGSSLVVTPLIVMHNAPVDNGGFTHQGVRVVPADRAVAVLRSLAGLPDPALAATVAAAAESVLPRYVEGSRR